jgi:hypothetical protein
MLLLAVHLEARQEREHLNQVIRAPPLPINKIALRIQTRKPTNT